MPIEQGDKYHKGGKMFVIRPIFRSIVLMASMILLAISYNNFMLSLPQPVMKTQANERASIALQRVNAPEKKIIELSIAVTNASAMTGISPELLVALVKTESEFKYKAISKKGYKGLMQTPWATMKWADVDILYGAKILQEKLQFSNNDLKLALALYKGGDNEEAHRYADETLKIYRRLL